MLKYNIKLTNDEIRREEIVWGEKYLAPDLSFVSGVTSQDYHLEKLNKIAVSTTGSRTPNSVLHIDTENVTREGFILIKGKEYPIESSATYNYDLSGETSIPYRYVTLNDTFYYENGRRFIIDNWLTKIDSETVKEQKYTSSIVQPTATTVKIDTIVWIEDGYATIDGNKLVYDYNLKGLKLKENTPILASSSITKCDSIEYYPYKNTNQHQHVSKIKLRKQEEIRELIENVSFIEYFYYIFYKDEMFIVSKNDNDKNNDGNPSFECRIPKKFLQEDGDEEYELFYVKYDDYDDDGNIQSLVANGNTLDILKDGIYYIEINGDKHNVFYDIINSNDGIALGVYLENSAYNIENGDTIRFVDTEIIDKTYNVYTMPSNSADTFVVFKGEKYKVEPNLCDKVLLGENEYDIKYISGKTIGNRCLVVIGEDEIPMIISGTSESPRLQNYGYVVSGISSGMTSAVTASYQINKYSGVTINDRKYIIRTYTDTSGETTDFAEIDIPNEYHFTVETIKGSSMLICKPKLEKTDYDEEFIRNYSKIICDDLVTRTEDFALYAKNKIFGSEEVTNDLAFKREIKPISSKDYFNLFDNMTLYTANAYIHIPLGLSIPHGNNLMQDDIVQNDFYKAEREKAINPIIDMEKDVYIPKYIKGRKYSGSTTNFLEVNSIRFNLHFRTRNLNSWKVNEDYNDISTSGKCNWFVTDVYPYTSMNSEINKKDKLESSDLVGLLNFTNDDIYYQKSKVANTFLRLSFYDSTDQQNQRLLATSTIFMDEHKLFKKYIDNSRKSLYNSMFVINNENNDGSAIYLNKISTKSEFLKSPSGTCYIDDAHRLGSEFIVTNKYETDTSSEGYYLYMFRDYSEKLKPKPIYMKVEFNHAGIGRIIPFIIPMKWSDSTDTYKYPERALTLKDENELKKGIKLEDAYAQSYIPLYAVYDFKHKEYAYVFDNRYVTLNEKTGDVTLNMFEIKFANDTDVSDASIEAITRHQQSTAKINVNAEQFNLNEKYNCD